jgi:hypothetical protein
VLERVSVSTITAIRLVVGSSSKLSLGETDKPLQELTEPDDACIVERSGDEPHTHNAAIVLNARPSSLAAFQPTLRSQSFYHRPRLTQGEFCPPENRANLRIEGSRARADGLAPLDSRLDVSLQPDAWGASTTW